LIFLLFLLELLACNLYIIITGEEACFDKQPENCVEWKKMGYCHHSKSFYKNWMTKNCPLSCKICKEIQPRLDDACHLDSTKKGKDCQTWTKLGYCTHKLRRYRIWMEENCPESCNNKCAVFPKEACENKR